MLHIIRADGRLHPGESMIFWEALDRWALSLSELTKGTRPATKVQSAPAPAQHRTRRRRLYRRIRSSTN
jgi:hypothetical protein